MKPTNITPGAIIVSALGDRFRRIRRVSDDGTVLWDEVRRSKLRPGMRTALLAQRSPMLAISAWGFRLATAEERVAVLDELEASP